MKTKINNFVRRLASISLDNCFNPYADVCAIFDQNSAPTIRQRNLTKILESVGSADSLDLWVGRDLGYRGGRRTGLALTDEHALSHYADHLCVESLDRSTLGPAVKERTASNVYRMLGRVDCKVLMWNVFPFHPHEHDRPFTNRAHNRREASIGYEILEELHGLFKFRQIIAIGNHAESCLNQVGYHATKVRHPSYGGQQDFMSQMNSIYRENSSSWCDQGLFSFSK